MSGLSGIYKIQSKLKPHKCYIGSATHITKRWGDHLRNLRKGKHANRRLQNHYNKYGESDLGFSILITCEIDALIIHEQFFIDSYNPFFNICRIAGNTVGVKRGPLSEERKLQISQFHKGRLVSVETRKRQSIALMGKNTWSKGAKRSEEYCKHLSELKRGNTNMLGKRHSEETREKMSKAGKGRICSDETRKKLSEKKKGRTLSAEQKEKIRQSLLGRKRGPYKYKTLFLN